MSREWQLGAIAMATACWSRGRPASEALAIRRIRGWERVEDWAFAYEFVSARPIAVIDPEDIADTQRLGEAYCAVNNVSIGPNVAADRIQAALREFANPTPRIEEPTGRWSRVVDGQGREWCRTEWDDGLNKPWQHQGIHAHWQSLSTHQAPLRIISPEETS